MLCKRIIPCLDIKDGRTVKGVNFEGLIDAGDPVELAKIYSENGADELVFLDIAATLEKRGTLIEMVKKVASNIQIPFTVGGGVRSVEDAYELLQAGADKISVNSAAFHTPELINKLSQRFGSQCVVLAIDGKEVGGELLVHTHGGKQATEKNLFEWAMEAEQLGAGEILFTSMNADGTKSGFDLKNLNKLSNLLRIPVIASGGAGTVNHFIDVFLQTNVDAALAASIFHFKEIEIKKLKQTLRENEVNVRL
jgi:imidazole glycerol-phosphate synthase subunit HisF